MSAALAARLSGMDGGGGDDAAVVRLGPEGDADALAEAARLLSAGRRVVVRVEARPGAELALIGALAHLVLAARRGGGELRLHAADGDLRDLATFLGLGDVLGVRATGDAVPRAAARPSSVEVQRQPQPLEDPAPEVLEEVVDVADAAVGDLEHLHGPGPVAALGVDPVLGEAGGTVDRQRDQP
jgi:hypothetical protein